MSIGSVYCSAADARQFRLLLFSVCFSVVSLALLRMPIYGMRMPRCSVYDNVYLSVESYRPGAVVHHMRARGLMLPRMFTTRNKSEVLLAIASGTTASHIGWHYKSRSVALSSAITVPNIGLEPSSVNMWMTWS